MRFYSFSWRKYAAYLELWRYRLVFSLRPVYRMRDRLMRYRLMFSLRSVYRMRDQLRIYAMKTSKNACIIRSECIFTHTYCCVSKLSKFGAYLYAVDEFSLRSVYRMRDRLMRYRLVFSLRPGVIDFNLY
jgi:hypothetical protein